MNKLSIAIAIIAFAMLLALGKAEQAQKADEPVGRYRLLTGEHWASTGRQSVGRKGNTKNRHCDRRGGSLENFVSERRLGGKMGTHRQIGSAYAGIPHQVPARYRRRPRRVGAA
jgi:hypothetical protein